jgi:hypothetical protein
MRPYFVTAPVRYIRAWLYIRSFIKYDMPGFALGAKVREGVR